VAEMAAARDIPIIGPHKEDKFWIDGMPDAAKQFGFPPVLAFEPDQWLEHGDVVAAADTNFDVVHCPGHTPGHVVFVQAEHKVAMVGDVLFKGSIGRTDFPKGDYQQLISSITDRLWPLGLDITFIPGHGPTSTFGFEKETNPFVSDTALG
ncbi:MAG: MBL fold metallo-hydrolase, partial [Pseudomonadota bacterium]|nr:MBL fold metallo-hydrolase [Pseudomonadota bacterium]